MSPRRRRALVGALVVVLLAVVTAVAVTRLRAADPVDQARPGPVLLVPGYGGSTASLQVLAAALRGLGRDVRVVALAGDGTGDLRVQAGRLQQAADAAVAAGAPSVDVVGYSAGGVVVRLWAAELGGAAVARRVVTLGAPHHGTTVAELGAALAPGACPLACQQLVPGSDLLAGLPETPDGPVWTSLWTTQDTTVTPPDSARLRGALDVAVQSVCADAVVAHGQLPRDPLVVGLVERALGAAQLGAPTPGDCAGLRAAGAAA